MASPKMIILGCLVLLLAMVVDATPPGIANHPAQATCKIKKYKMCYNLPHVCPKFCPDACEVECASCKPICSGSSAPYVPPPSDSESGGDKSPPLTYVSPPSDGKKGKDDGEKGKDDGEKGKDDGEKGKDDGEKGKDDGEKGKDKGKKDGATPSDGSGSTPPYSPPPRPIVDPFPPPPPTYSPPTLPPSPPPLTPTPTYSPPTPTPSPPTTPPSSPSPLPKPPTLSPPTQTPPRPSPTPPTPSSSPPPYSPPPTPTPSPPTPVTPTPSSPPPPTPTPSPVTPTPSYSPPPPPTTPILSPPTPPTPSVPWTPPSPPSTPTPTPTPPTPSVPWTPTPTQTPPTPSSPPSSPYPPPSTPWTPPQSPPYSDVASRKRVRCTKKEYGACYGQEFTCPANCPTSCQIDCNSCKPVCSCDYPGAVCQDPRFIGGDGITFYFHGKKDRDFCLVSDPNLHINAHFIGKRNSQMSRDFTWVQSLGILFDNHRLSISALKTATWDDSVDRLSLSLDDTPIALDPTTSGLEWRSTTTPQVKITRISQFNNIILEIQDKITLTIRVTPISEEESRVHNYNITSEDCFAHLDLGFKFHSLSKVVDGVLGKTYRDDYVSRVKMGVPMPVLGGDKEYSTSNLFATDCLASKFNIYNKNNNNYNGDEEEVSTLKNFGEFGSMNCNSGMNGEGVVCKR